MDSNVLLAAVVPLVLLAAALVVFCLVDIARRPQTRGLPAWAWALLVVLSIPLGAIVYLLVGRQRA